MTNNNECKTEGCNKPVRVKKRQLCSTHYQMWSRANKPVAGVKPCSIEECEEVYYARGWCQSHYTKWRLHGDPEYKWSPKYEGMTCQEEGCEKPVSSNYVCKAHYMYWWNNVCDTPFNPNHRNVKEDAGYAAAHYRVRRTKGKASNHKCVDCGEQAKDWTLRHDAQDKRIEVSDNKRTNGAAFSLNMDDYLPRCDNCHKAYDTKWENRKDKTGPKGPRKKVSA